MAKIQYLSDLHIELMHTKQFQNLCKKIIPQCDILVLAGDIGNPMHSSNMYRIFLESMSQKFEKVFVITGNHEYYGNHKTETDMRIHEICNTRNNISFLDNSTELYDGYRFIGTTQWTHIHDPVHLITDFTAIHNMTVARYNHLHETSRIFLENAIDNATANNEKSIVVTHHVPLHELTHQKYKQGHMAKYNQCFSANLFPILEKKNTISAWIYGHTHTKSVQTHGAVHFLCNPLGYKNENNGIEINHTFTL